MRVTIKSEKLLNKSNPGAKIVGRIGHEDKKVDSLPSRLDVLSAIKAEVDSSTVVIISTGKGGRELFELGDMDNNFYMVGSMGCASSIGLGLSLVKPKAKVIVVDGDGAVLMRLGSLATNAFYNPSNLIHILLDNETHDSTGGQFTVSPIVDFLQVASACGYPSVGISKTAEDLRSAIIDWKNSPSLSFHNIKIKKGSKKDLGRPTVKPFEVTPC
ncbi:MAG: thiamine pyrophosphate-dependent enzyme [Spirochaetota bacterium]|nr:thiamine pyrophosphate-dependent enzyme [Spirochaetota bacterium]